MSSTSFAILLVLLTVTSILGHSQMRCANSDPKTGKCLAPIRASGMSFDKQATKITEGVCQFPMSNPISSSYSNGEGCGYAPCPDAMGKIAQGEVINVTWFARNHAVDNQTPGKVDIYLSPVESMNQGLDVSTSQFAANKFCEAPYMSCNGDNGDTVLCSTACKMPQNLVAGIYTIWWKWSWRSDEVYVTCADVYVTGSSSSTPSTPSTPSTTPTTPPVVTKPSTTAAVAKPSTTAAVKTPVSPATTSKAAPMVMTTGGNKVVPTTPSTTGRVNIVTPPTVTPAPTPSVPTTPSESPCILGSQVCIGSNQYQTCTNGREANYWAPAQTCNTGTVCQPSTQAQSANKIYCV